jgi:hypothetical protein
MPEMKCDFANFQEKAYNRTKMKGNANLVLTFFSWWYGEAFAKLFVFFERFIVYLADFFSVKTSLRTLFAPWKRDLISSENLSIQEKFQIMTLNATSRLIGAIVKLITIGIFLIVGLFAIVVELVLMVIWLLWPAVIAGLVYLGLKTITGA